MQRIVLRSTLLLLLILPAVTCHAEAPAAVHDQFFTFHFSDPGYAEQADSILNATRRRLQTLLGDSLDFNADVYMASTLQQFDSLVGGRFPEWGAAAAVSHLRRIVLKSPSRFNVNKPFRELLAHEYAHLALANRLGWREPPRWFNEGLAIMVSMEWRWSDDLTMSLSSLAGRFVPLKKIDGVNLMGQGEAHLAYSESYLAVQYLYDVYGVDGVGLFLDSVAAGNSYDDAFMAGIGSNYAGFEGEFREYLDQRFNLVSLLTDMSYFWLGLAIILIIGAILTFRRKRKYIQKWDEDERLASTDFDYGDPDHPEQPDDDDEAWRH